MAFLNRLSKANMEEETKKHQRTLYGTQSTKPHSTACPRYRLNDFLTHVVDNRLEGPLWRIVSMAWTSFYCKGFGDGSEPALHVWESDEALRHFHGGNNPVLYVKVVASSNRLSRVSSATLLISSDLPSMKI